MYLQSNLSLNSDHLSTYKHQFWVLFLAFVSQRIYNGQYFVFVQKFGYIFKISCFFQELFKRVIPHQCLGAVWSRRREKSSRDKEAGTVVATVDQVMIMPREHPPFLQNSYCIFIKDWCCSRYGTKAFLE